MIDCRKVCRTIASVHLPLICMDNREYGMSKLVQIIMACLLACSVSAAGAEADSLKRVMAGASACGDSGLVLDCSHRLAVLYFNTLRDEDSACRYARIADSLAADLGDVSLRCEANAILGYLSMNYDADMESATSYFLKSLELSDGLGDRSVRHTCLANLVMAYYNRSDTSGMKYARALFEDVKGSPASQQFIMGAVSCAFMFDVSRLYDSAVFYMDRAVKAYGDREIPSTLYALYGSILSNAGRYDEAEYWFGEGLRSRYPADMFLEYGEHKLRCGDYDRGIGYILRSLEAIRGTGMNLHIKKHYLDLSEAYRKKGDYMRALEYYEAYDRLQDSIFSIEKENAVNELMVKYQAEQKDREIQAKELQLARESKKTQLMLSLVCLSAVVIIAVYLQYKRKNQMYRQLVIQHQEYMLREKMGREAKSSDTDKGKDMFARIESLMRDQGLYKRKDLTIDVLTEILDSNRTYVSKVVNSYSGMNFNNYVNSFRIDKAVSLLTETEIPVKVLVDELGFNSTSAFYRAFQNSIGVPPLKYREEVRALGRS